MVRCILLNQNISEGESSGPSYKKMSPSSFMKSIFFIFSVFSEDAETRLCLFKKRSNSV